MPGKCTLTNYFRNGCGNYPKSNMVLLGLMLFGSLVCSRNSDAQTWQATLDQAFDYVETFDQLQDWTGKTNGYACDMPISASGATLIWDEYSYYGPPDDFSQKLIAFHGADFVWRQNGKSLCLDYGGNKGPSRMGFHIGTSPADGYSREVYVFFFNKYHKAFFPMLNETEFSWYGFFKTFQISTGFRDVNNWGRVEEQAITDHTDQVDHVYGLNFFIINFSSGASLNNRLKLSNNVYCSNSDGKHYYEEYSKAVPNADISDPIVQNKWFALEYRFMKSSPAGTANGCAEFWVYDQLGKVIGHELVPNLITFKNSIFQYDHAYNKFIWGGNRDDYIQKGFLRGKVCIPDASRDVLKVENHLRETGEFFKIFADGGATPQPLVDQKGYYVIKLNNNELRVASSYADALNNKYIDLTANGSGIVYISCVSHLYIDDIIVNSSRIGPKYFSLLFGNNPDIEPPDPPTGVTVRNATSQQPDNLSASLNLTAQTSSNKMRDNLSNVRVYMDERDYNSKSRCIVFDHLIKSTTIKIFDQSDHLLYKIENYQQPIFYWFGFDCNGNKIPPGEYRYEITSGVDAVAGKIRIE